MEVGTKLYSYLENSFPFLQYPSVIVEGTVTQQFTKQFKDFKGEDVEKGVVEVSGTCDGQKFLFDAFFDSAESDDKKEVVFWAHPIVPLQNKFNIWYSDKKYAVKALEQKIESEIKTLNELSESLSNFGKDEKEDTKE